MRFPFIAWGLISGMIKGACSRKAELESMQIHLAFGIHCLDIAEPAQKKAKSVESNSSRVSTGME